MNAGLDPVWSKKLNGGHSRNTIATESKVVTCLRSSRISASLHGFRSLQATQQRRVFAPTDH